MIVVVPAGCYTGSAGLPDGMAGATARDTDMDHRPDLWLKYSGSALTAAAADTDIDTIADTVVQEGKAGLTVSLDYDRIGGYDCRTFVQGMNTEDFRRALPGAVLNPYAGRPRHVDLFQLTADTRFDGSHDVEVIARQHWCRVTYDSNNDGVFDVAAIYEDRKLSRVEMDLDNDGTWDLWGVFENGDATIIKWLSEGKVYYWMTDGDRYGVDENADSSVDRIIPADADPSAPLAVEIYRGLEALRKRLAGK
ncbi:MAG: hypothetical protein JW909_08410 [Planctomycetes bacterium]|nr:hypothetical protein [Planctomycetota bacterium]